MVQRSVEPRTPRYPPPDRVITDVAQRGELPSRVTATDAVRAVLCVLTQRLSGGETSHLLSALPGTTRELLAPCTLHRGEPGGHYRLDAFLRRVSDHLGVSVEDARDLTERVFAALRSQLPAEEVRHVRLQLPDDLAQLWVPGGERPLPGPSNIKGQPPMMSMPVARDVPLSHPVLRDLESKAHLPSGVTGGGAFAAVLCTLCTRLSRGAALQLSDALPEPLRRLVEPCAVERGERGEAFGRDDLVRRVAEHLAVEEAAVTRAVADVLRAAADLLPDAVVEDVAAQLPPELATLLRPHNPGF